jgi:YVTN family beta-propeller protein
MYDEKTRRTLLSWGALALAGLATPRTACAATTSLTGKVYTADELGGTLSEIDLASGAITKAATSIAPHNVQYVPQPRLILTVGDVQKAGKGTDHAGHGASKGSKTGRLLIYAADQIAAGPTAEIELDGHPGHVVADAGGREAFVTIAANDSISIVDLASRSITGRVSTGRFPHGLRMSPDGQEICVANVRDGTVSFIAVAGRKEDARIAVGKAPVQVAYSPDGDRIHVSLRDENSVATIDRRTRTIIARTPVGPKPIQTFVSPDGRWLIAANQGSDAKPNDTVSIIATDTMQVASTLKTGRGAHGVVISDDSSWAFVSNIHDGTVSVVDLRALKVVRQYRVGRGPNGISYAAP